MTNGIFHKVFILGNIQSMGVEIQSKRIDCYASSSFSITRQLNANLSTAYLKFAKIVVCFLWLLMLGDCRVTDEALLVETT